jgi:hypothetical protein
LHISRAKKIILKLDLAHTHHHLDYSNGKKLKENMIVKKKKLKSMFNIIDLIHTLIRFKWCLLQILYEVKCEKGLNSTVVFIHTNYHHWCEKDLGTK